MGSWKLGKLAGINVSVHWTLLLMVGIFAIMAPAGSVVWNVTFMVAIFGCILLHEIGHALAARQFGIQTAGITLMPIGGLAMLERMPREPLQELWIAVAGPLVNVAIAAGIFLALGPAVQLTTGTELIGISSWLQYLMFANMGLVLFNMIPAFPMDGGRIFRSMMATTLPYERATAIAARVGRYVAIGLGLFGLFSGNFMLIFVAGFVFLAGTAEAQSVAMQSAARARTAYGSGFGQAGFGQPGFGKPFEFRFSTDGTPTPPEAENRSTQPEDRTEPRYGNYRPNSVVWDEQEQRYRSV